MDPTISNYLYHLGKIMRLAPELFTTQNTIKDLGARLKEIPRLSREDIVTLVDQIAITIEKVTEEKKTRVAECSD